IRRFGGTVPGPSVLTAWLKSGWEPDGGRIAGGADGAGSALRIGVPSPTPPPGELGAAGGAAGVGLPRSAAGHCGAGRGLSLVGPPEALPGQGRAGGAGGVSGVLKSLLTRISTLASGGVAQVTPDSVWPVIVRAVSW